MLDDDVAFEEVEGRGGSSSCEIHLNGDYIFVAIALLAAGLAYITYTTITKGRRRKKRWFTEETDASDNSALTAILLGIPRVSLSLDVGTIGKVQNNNDLKCAMNCIAYLYLSTQFV